MRKTLLLSFFIIGSFAAKAQDVLSLTLDGSEQGKTLPVLLKEIEQKNGARFYFLPEWLAQITVQESYKGQTLSDLLADLFAGTDLRYFPMYPHAIVIIKDPTQPLLRQSAIQAATRQQKKVEPRAVGDPQKSKKGNVTITGTVIDSKTRQPLPRTSVIVRDTTQYGTTTDESGKYSLSFPTGAHVISFSFVDYEDKIIDLAVYNDGVINIELDEMPIMLDEVVIQYQTARELATSRIGQTQITIKEIKRAPALLGEADIIKQVQVLPGVTTVGEAASGFNVRGGSVDQNLILYDGLPIFNSSHVFGFLSSFNPEAIREVSFYRGGIPSEYGGRVSSVLDIHSKDGDFKKWNGNAGIGMITSNVMVNGPLKNDKTSLAVSLRSTYSNWLIHSVKTNYADLRNSNVFFYDGAVKLAHKFSDKTKLSVTGYSSKDAFRLIGDTTYQWSNVQGSARLDHQFSPKLNSEFILGVSSYGYSVLNDEVTTASKLSYRITTTALKSGFNYQEGKHKINFGWQFLNYQFNPGSLEPESSQSNAKNVQLDKQYSIENAYYGADEWALNEKLSVEAGLRLSLFASFGSATVYQYKENTPREVTNVSDTLKFKGGENIKTYVGLEPRLSFRWMTSPTGSIKLGYNRMYQYLHLVTNTTAVTPVDIWQPSGYYFKPQRSDQISIGYFKEFTDQKYGASVEGFYKVLKNIIDFKDGAQLILNRHLETDLLQGKGESYGIETSVSKNTGVLTGTLNYTYSRSFRTIAGPTDAESINSGNKYPSNFDQPHILNFSWKYNLTRRHFFTGNFTYHTGRPVTIPLSAFQFENTSVAYFSGRNQYRIPDYHRLDVALIIEGNHKRKKKFEGTWVISVYNVYARKNPYTVFFKSTNNGIPKPYQLSIIGTVLPSISYNIKF